MQLARKALEDQGYEVVDFDLTEGELELGRKYLVGMVANTSAPGLARDCEKQGENLQLDNWLNIFLLNRGRCAKGCIHKILGLAN